jgi:hypothetical protein
MAVPVKEDHRHVDTSVDIDLGETAFHLVTLGAAGKVLVRKKFTHIAGLHRKHAELTDRLGGVLGCPSCWPRTASQGHDVRLIPTQLAKPLVKFNKNDLIDAEANRRGRRIQEHALCSGPRRTINWICRRSIECGSPHELERISADAGCTCIRKTTGICLSWPRPSSLPPTTVLRSDCRRASDSRSQNTINRLWKRVLSHTLLTHRNRLAHNFEAIPQEFRFIGSECLRQRLLSFCNCLQLPSEKRRIAHR